MTAFKEQLDCIQCFNAFSFKDSCSFLTSCQWQPEASPIPTTKLKQPTLHWAQVVSVTAGLASDLDWPALAALWNAFFLLTCRASNASSFFHDFDEAVCSGISFLLDDRRSLQISFISTSLCHFCANICKHMLRQSQCSLVNSMLF